jgi:glycosyltransferase involved in cell wall biosynthesis
MKLSIITVCKNAEKLLVKTIESVLAQTFTDYEYIIIDGASTDGSLSVIDNYKDRIKIISEPDKGIYDAMNKGIGLSEGEYLLFLNAGDYFFHENVLKEIMEMNLNVDILYSNGLIEFSNGFLFCKTFPKKVTKIFMYMDTLPHQDALVKREVFLKTRGFDSEYKISGDYKFFLDAVFKYNCTSKYVQKMITVNDLKGLSNQKDLRQTIRDEREKAISEHVTEFELMLLKIIKPIYFLLIKYPKYLMNLLQSINLNIRK